MKYRFEHEDKCCGCGLCYASCPAKAIDMKQNAEGFLYPAADASLCIECGQCNEICSYGSKTVQAGNTPVSAYICRAEDEEILMGSASGGVFSVFAGGFVKNGGYVAGASFDSNMDVIHIIGNTDRDVKALRGSKYVQSSILSCYDAVAGLLENGGRILFSGTPCQIAAITGYLNFKKIDTGNLITCSIICHGVNSGRIWRDYLKFLSADIGEIRSVNMRDKRFGAGYNMTVRGTKGVYEKKGTEDPFIMLFTKNLALRKSCFNCPMKNLKQVSDLTIGDFHYAKKFYPQYCDGKGVSVLLVNTEKGAKLFDSVSEKFDYEKTSMEKAAQPNLIKQIDKSFLEQRNIFFDFVDKNGFAKALSEYTEVGFKNRVLGAGKRIIKKLIGR